MSEDLLSTSYSPKMLRLLSLSQAETVAANALKIGRKAAYISWRNMKARVLNPKSTRYADYGGRGIKIYGLWLDFDEFFEFMGPRPEGMSLNRIDNNGHYVPSNCEWATVSSQNKNRRSSAETAAAREQYTTRARQV